MNPKDYDYKTPEEAQKIIDNFNKYLNPKFKFVYNQGDRK